MNEHRLVLLLIAALIVGSIALAYNTLIDVSADAQGTVRTNGEMRVTAATGGKIVNVYLRQGQAVHTGDPLLQLDTHQLDHDLRLLQTRIHVLETRRLHVADEIIRARLRNLYRQLHLTELARAQLTVSSPADGLLEGMHSLRIGQSISEGEEIATIVPSDRDLSVEVPIRESILELVYVGQLVRMEPGYRTDEGGTGFLGVVQNIKPQMQPGGMVHEYLVVIIPNDESSVRYENELRVKFLQPRRRLLKVMMDRVNVAVSRFWHPNKLNQPGSTDPGRLAERLRRAG